MNIIRINVNNDEGSTASSTLDDNLDLNRCILKFIRLRESAQFKADMKKKSYDKQYISLSNRINQFVSKVHAKTVKKDIPTTSNQNESLDYEDLANSDNEMQASSSDAEDSTETNKAIKIKLEESHSCEQVWRKINNYLDDLKENDIDDYLTYYTAIIKLHVEHKITLDHMCLPSITNCIEPAQIQSLFNLELVDTVNPFVFNCIFEQRLIFNSLKTSLYNIGSTEPFYLIMSMAVLIYKSDCVKFAKAIKSALIKNLASFINGKHYDDKFKEKGVKQFLKACILNGILNKSGLSSFLSITERSHNHNHFEEDSENSSAMSDDDHDGGSSDEMDLHMELDTDEEEDEDDDDDNSEIGGRIVHPVVRHQHQHQPRDMNNNNNELPNNNNARQPNRPVVRTIKDIVNADVDEFPLSLKNLARIYIKNTIRDYAPSSVDQLRILPDVLKKFVLFEDEVDVIVKLTVKPPRASSN